MKMSSSSPRVQHLNPTGLDKNPAYSQAVIIDGPVRTIYVGGQNSVDSTGRVVGKGDIAAQTEQIFKNLAIALAAGGAELEHVIKWNIYVMQGQPIQPAFAIFQRVWGNRPNPPIISTIFVAGLAHPDYLAEIEAVAVLPG